MIMLRFTCLPDVRSAGEMSELFIVSLRFLSFKFMAALCCDSKQEFYRRAIKRNNSYDTPRVRLIVQHQPHTRVASRCVNAPRPGEVFHSSVCSIETDTERALKIIKISVFTIIGSAHESFTTFMKIQLNIPPAKKIAKSIYRKNNIFRALHIVMPQPAPCRTSNIGFTQKIDVIKFLQHLSCSFMWNRQIIELIFILTCGK